MGRFFIRASFVACGEDEITLSSFVVAKHNFSCESYNSIITANFDLNERHEFSTI